MLVFGGVILLSFEVVKMTKLVAVDGDMKSSLRALKTQGALGNFQLDWYGSDGCNISSGTKRLRKNATKPTYSEEKKAFSF